MPRVRAANRDRKLEWNVTMCGPLHSTANPSPSSFLSRSPSSVPVRLNASLAAALGKPDRAGSKCLIRAQHNCGK